MCECEELDYDDFVTVLQAIKVRPAVVEAVSQEPEMVPLAVSTKRKK
jgi:hypothetical protein